MKPEERRILENLRDYQKFQKDSIADAMAALVEVSNAVLAMTDKLVQLFDQQAEMNARVNRYIFDQAQQDGKVAKLDKLVSEVREIHARASGGKR